MSRPIQPDVATRHRDALTEYLRAPEHSAQRAEADYRLSLVENRLCERPPGYRDGLISAEQARACATSGMLQRLAGLSMPRRSRIRDDFKIIPEREWSDAIEQRKRVEAQNRPLVRFTLDQNGFGSCASEGIAGATIYCEQKQGGVDLKVKPLNALGLYRYVNGGRDGGSSLSDNIAAAFRYGIPTEEVWPRSKGWRTPLSDEAKEDALRHRPHEVYRVGSKEEFGTALLLGFVVYAGYSGHAWFAVDLIDTTRFIWKNSWGSGWADNGFGTLRFSEVAWVYGCWAIRTARRAT